MADGLITSIKKKIHFAEEDPIGKTAAYELVHWMNRQLKKYHNHPPKNLVKTIAKEKRISCRKAKKEITPDMVISFLVEKVGEASGRYGDTAIEPDPALMRKILLDIEAGLDR